jgi:hypothetical protein
MKGLLSILAGMVFLLALGTIYAADDTMQLNYDEIDKMILDRDLQKYNQDREVNQMQAEPGAGGSAAGGSGESTLKDDSAEKAGPAPEESITPDPYDGSRRGKDDPYNDIEKYDHDIYRY